MPSRAAWGRHRLIWFQRRDHVLIAFILTILYQGSSAALAEFHCDLERFISTTRSSHIINGDLNMGQLDNQEIAARSCSTKQSHLIQILINFSLHNEINSVTIEDFITDHLLLFLKLGCSEFTNEFAGITQLDHNTDFVSCKKVLPIIASTKWDEIH